MRLRPDGYALFGAVAMLVLLPLLLAWPVWVGGLGAVTVALWWLGTLDWWRRFYALTLVCAVATTSNLEALATVGGLGRFPSVFLLLLGSWAAWKRATKSPLSKLQKRILTALWVIVAVAAVSMFWSVAPLGTIIQATALGVFVCILQLLMRGRWSDKATMLGDLNVGYVVLTASVVISLGLWAAGYPSAIRGERLQGIYNNPNIASQMAAFSIFLGWALYKHRPIFLRVGLAVPALIMLVLADSRTSFVAVAVAFVWLIARSTPRVYMRALYAGTLAVCVSVIAGWRPLTPVLDRFDSTAGGDLLGGRLDAWAPTVELILEQPVGYGWAASGALFKSLFGYAWFEFNHASVHSSYLQFLLEIGALGLIPLLYLLAVFALIGFRGPMAGPGAGLVGVVVAGVCIQAAESSMFGIGQPYPFIFWFAVAAALTIYEPKKPKQREVLKPTRPRQTALR